MRTPRNATETRRRFEALPGYNQDGTMSKVDEPLGHYIRVRIFDETKAFNGRGFAGRGEVTVSEFVVSHTQAARLIGELASALAFTPAAEGWD